VAHECRHGLPCFGLSACYGHLKAAALNGGRDKLTDEERAFVGVGASRRREGLGGCASPPTPPTSSTRSCSAEDTGLLQALMNAGHADRVEFMTG